MSCAYIYIRWRALLRTVLRLAQNGGGNYHRFHPVSTLRRNGIRANVIVLDSELIQRTAFSPCGQESTDSIGGGTHLLISPGYRDLEGHYTAKILNGRA